MVMNRKIKKNAGITLIALVITIVPFKNLINDEYCRDISNKIKAVLNVKWKNIHICRTY